MKEIFDSKQEQILFCDSGKAFVYYNEETVTVKEQRQTGDDTYEEVEVEKYMYDVVKVSCEKTRASVIEALKEVRLAELTVYDKSRNVDNCYVSHNGVTFPYWAKKDERSDLRGAVAAKISEGDDTYRLDLRDLGLSINVPCEPFLSMLNSLEVYAIKCYNKTTDHIFAINAFDESSSIEEIMGYDFTTGYPENPTYEL